MVRGKRRSKVRTANAGALKGFQEATKYETRILGDIQQHIVQRRVEDTSRDQTVLHPSEISKKDWCPRASYYRLVGVPESDPSKRDPGYVIINIWDEGHEVGRKYQTRLWEMGRLRGEFGCTVCATTWPGIAPMECPACHAPRSALEYLEVPGYNAEHMLGCHADGDIAEGNVNERDDPLLEIKTIGIGTVRAEAPGLLADHTYRVPVLSGDPVGLSDGEEWWESSDPGNWGRITAKTLVDLDGLWRSIKRPFPSHIKQGGLYCFVFGRTHIVFIYECKWNQQTKEFVVRARPEHIEGVLDGCKDVRYAIDKGKPPLRPSWAAVEHTSCKGCVYRSHCWDLEQESENHESEEGSGLRAGASRRRGEGPDGSGRSEPPGTSSVQGPGWPAEVAARTPRVVRRLSDAALRGADEVD